MLTALCQDHLATDAVTPSNPCVCFSAREVHLTSVGEKGLTGQAFRKADVAAAINKGGHPKAQHAMLEQCSRLAPGCRIYLCITSDHDHSTRHQGHGSHLVFGT